MTFKYLEIVIIAYGYLFFIFLPSYLEYKFDNCIFLFYFVIKLLKIDRIKRLCISKLNGRRITV